MKSQKIVFSTIFAALIATSSAALHGTYQNREWFYDSNELKKTATTYGINSPEYLTLQDEMCAKIMGTSSTSPVISPDKDTQEDQKKPHTFSSKSSVWEAFGYLLQFGKLVCELVFAILGK